MREQDLFNYELKDVSVEEIDIGKRKRKDFGDLESFAAEIGEFGLHHPILLLDKSFVEDLDGREEDPNRPYLLLAGERRLRAVKMNKWAEISAKVSLRDLSEWEIQVIELHENIQRKSMTPLEEAKSKKDIHELYQKIYGVAERGPGNEGHSIADTANLLGESRATTSLDLEVAEFADAIPELETAKTKSEARKMVKALKEKMIREEIAKREERKRKAKAQGKETRVNPIEKRRSALYQRYVVGDFFDEVSKIQTRTVDLFELDPDWGIKFKEAVQATGSLTADDYDTIEPEEYEEKLRAFAKEAWRIMKDNSWLICWYSVEDWNDPTKEILESEGFSVQHMPAFWIHSSNKTATPAYRLAQRTEAFFYARKGNPRIGEMGHPNTFTYRTLSKNERNHPAEKPIELYQDIINTFLGKKRKAAVCVTACAGSGNFILAADNAGHNGLGFDTAKTYKDDYVIKVSNGTPGEYKSYKNT